MSHTKQHSYSSSRVQRASKINTIETAKLEKQLSYFEQAMIHQCRLTNRAIRLMSIFVDYIKSSSGHSPEAWHPDKLTESPSELHSQQQTPFFLYGERIWTRKKRKLYKPLSSTSRPWSHREDDGPSKGAEDIPGDLTGRSSPERGSDSEQHTPVSGGPCVGVHPRGGRVTPHQAWEDDTDEVTRKIFKNQARCMEGQRHTVYQSSGEMMVAHAARNVRGLVRQIKISGRHPVTDSDISLSTSRSYSRLRYLKSDGHDDDRKKKSDNEELSREKVETRVSNRTGISSAATSRPKSAATC
ncbi:hypothetical protein Btru_000299 [Bulinus truncatus]|nr:hypothetical protein Btru_000299 [Bulinus truncatus]